MREVTKMKNQFKIALAVALLAAFLGSAFSTQAYPPFVKKAAKFGATNCLFCHTEAEGGEGWNERGKFLIAEKEKRKADAIDVEWLADYKEGEKKEGEGENKEKEKEKKKDPAR